MRCGVIAKKLGMTRSWDENGNKLPVTVLQMDNVVVTDVRTQEKHGYDAIQLGAGLRKANRTNKPQKVSYAAKQLDPRQNVQEFRVSDGNLLSVGDELSAEHFAIGQMVDVSGTTVGKGFAGAMKRHHFSGLRASHGVSISHRSHGSTGQCQDPGKVFKGKKMAGQMGNRRVTTQNLKIVEIDVEKDLLFVLGSVPGSKNSWVRVQDAIKQPLNEAAPTPAGLKAKHKEADKAEEKATVVEDIKADDANSNSEEN